MERSEPLRSSGDWLPIATEFASKTLLKIDLFLTLFLKIKKCVLRKVFVDRDKLLLNISNSIDFVIVVTHLSLESEFN